MTNPPNPSPSMPQSDIRAEIIAHLTQNIWRVTNDTRHYAKKEAEKLVETLITSHTKALLTELLEQATEFKGTFFDPKIHVARKVIPASILEDKLKELK